MSKMKACPKCERGIARDGQCPRCDQVDPIISAAVDIGIGMAISSLLSSGDSSSSSSDYSGSSDLSSSSSDWSGGGGDFSGGGASGDY